MNNSRYYRSRSPSSFVTPQAQRYGPVDVFHGIANDDLSRLVQAAQLAMQTRGMQPPLPPQGYSLIPPPPPPQPRQPIINPPRTPPRPPVYSVHDIWENARIEQVMCTGLKPHYDGSPEQLLPTLNLIHIRRQNEAWAPATYLLQNGKLVDLVLQFSAIKEETVKAQAKCLWDTPDAVTQRHMQGSATSNARLFGTFLLNSMTPEFSAIVFSRIDPQYCSDGPLILFVMCQHIHRNHLAFVETTKNKIRLSTLSEHKNDVRTYLRFLHDNLKVISSTGSDDNEHKDLIPHILLQLRTTTIPLFQQSILKWQREYFENTFPLTPSLLVQKADQEVQILKHAGQWVETIDPSVTAMQATLKATKDRSGELLKSLVANFSQHSQRQRDGSRSYRSSSQLKYQNGRHQTPDWLLDRPSDPREVKYFNGRQWHFCDKCGRSGRWVCTHSTETHGDRSRSSSPMSRVNGHDNYHLASSQDDLRRSRSPHRSDPYADRHSNKRWEGRSRSRSPTSGGYASSDAQSPRRHVTWGTRSPSTPVAKLSLLDSITAFFDE